MTKSFIILLAWVAVIAVAALSSSAQQTVERRVTSSARNELSVNTVNGESVVSLNGQTIYTGPTKGQVTSRSTSINGESFTAVFDGDTVLWENTPGAASKIKSGTGSDVTGDHQKFSEEHQRTVERMMEEQRQFMQSNGGTNFTRSGSGGFSSGGGSSGGSSSGQRGGGGYGFSNGQSGSGGGTSTRSGSFSKSNNSSVGVKSVNGSTVITYQGKEVSVGPTEGLVSTKTAIINGTDYAAAFEGNRVIWENVPGAARQMK